MFLDISIKKLLIPDTTKNADIFQYKGVEYIDGSRSVDRINFSLVIPVNRQRQSGG